MLTLFTVMTLVIGAASVVSLDRFLTGQLDDQLRASLNRIPPQFGGTSSPTTPRDGDGDLGRGPGDEGFVVVVGAVVAVVVPDGFVVVVVVLDDVVVVEFGFG